MDGGAAAAVATGANVLTLAGDVTFVQLTDLPAGFADTPPARLSGVVDLGGANRTFAGIYSNQNTIGAPNVDLAIDARLTGAGGFVKGGSLTDPRAWMSLTNPLNSYTGPTILEAGSERLYLGAANVIPAASAVQVRNLSELYLTSSAVQATGVSFSQTVGSLSDGGTAGGMVRLGWADAAPAVLTAGGDNTSTAFAGQVVGGGSLVKVGAGTLTLSGANTYTGGTTVSAGTLLVTGQTGSASGTGTGAVVVGPGGTLGGTGQALGPVTVRGRVMGGDGVTALGNPVLTAGGVTFETASRLRVAVGGSTPAGVTNSRVSVGAGAFDRSAVSDVMLIELVNAGDLDLSGTSTYTVTVAAYGSTTATPANFSVTAVNFALAELPVVTVTGAGLEVRFVPAPVPEPAAVLALAAAGLAAVGLARLVRPRYRTAGGLTLTRARRSGSLARRTLSSAPGRPPRSS
ncbi:MAG: autotransporter-associated beta strand repeat-containing protein [Gemmataceae bacterium]